MRLEPKGLAAELRAEPAETTDHLVANDVDVVRRADRQHLVEIGRGRNQHPARTHDRLDEERRDRVWPFPLDQRVELGGEPGRKFRLALALMREAIMMRA